MLRTRGARTIVLILFFIACMFVCNNIHFTLTFGINDQQRHSVTVDWQGGSSLNVNGSSR